SAFCLVEHEVLEVPSWPHVMSAAMSTTNYSQSPTKSAPEHLIVSNAPFRRWPRFVQTAGSPLLATALKTPNNSIAARTVRVGKANPKQPTGYRDPAND